MWETRNDDKHHCFDDPSLLQHSLTHFSKTNSPKFSDQSLSFLLMSSQLSTTCMMAFILILPRTMVASLLLFLCCDWFSDCRSNGNLDSSVLFAQTETALWERFLRIVSRWSRTPFWGVWIKITRQCQLGDQLHFYYFRNNVIDILEWVMCQNTINVRERRILVRHLSYS